MEQTHETLAAQIFELFDTGEEAVEFLSKHNIAENHYLLRDLERLCAALASGIEALLPQLELQNKLKEFGLNAPLTAARVLEALEAGAEECALLPAREEHALLLELLCRHGHGTAVGR